MSAVELFVGLKIPDTTAITTFHTIEKMGYKIGKVKREMYYKFEIDGDAEKFSKKIGKVDVLVNANKNKFSHVLEKDADAVYVLVSDTDDKCEGLMHVLKERLELKEITSMEKGVLWALYIDAADKEKIAKEIASKLLHNENYQEIKIV
ncbi:MAG: hypothetical protein KKC75_05185 [Nanoarchaeota archaeon]|nr:hypothetical protein [Nanoarchaeota archaeon]MBU1004847.1 hypothetical protein [Nanoarchaeota archaeon]MBU1946785.1 hypothetical protein [Nanoarchaeota archaeon]